MSLLKLHIYTAENLKNLLFDINKYKKFKDKIIYKVIDKEPPDIEEIYDKDDDEKRYKRSKTCKQ